MRDLRRRAVSFGARRRGPERWSRNKGVGIVGLIRNRQKNRATSNRVQRER
jgi:hypothetical protein